MKLRPETLIRRLECLSMFEDTEIDKIASELPTCWTTVSHAIRLIDSVTSITSWDRNYLKRELAVRIEN